MMSPAERAAEEIASFSNIEDWEDRYKRVIAAGKELPELAEEHRVEKNLVKGCQSQVWLTARLDDGRVVLEADSDAVIVRGLVSLLLKVYSNATPDEILATPPTFLEEMGFKKNLSPSRANGLFSMVKQIQLYAYAFKTMLGQKAGQ